ncbi:MAG: methyl-accepting chemotaxis protein, partial [Firmicutes bacterium HGW-Firmicutes-6]
MKWFFNLKIGQKVILGYLVIVVMAGGIGAMGLWGIHKISEQDVYLYEKMAKPLGELVYIVDSFQGILGNVDDLIQSTSQEEIDFIESEILKKNSKFDANLKTFQTTLMSPEAIQIADETYLLKDKLDTMVTEMINLARAGKPAEVA